VPKQRYLFQAEATGVGAQFFQPFNEVIPIQAASALTVDGGRGFSRIEDFGFRAERFGYFGYKDIVSFDTAYTEVVGVEIEEGVFETVALSVVENFDLLGVVKCDRIVGILTGTYPGGPKGSENSIVPTGSFFEGLRIDDISFDKLDIAPDFFCTPERSCWSGLVGAMANERERRLLESLSLPDANGDPVPLPSVGTRRDLLGFSIALGEPEDEAELGAPLNFTVPDFGTVHLGEFFCQPNSRRLIMLRIELDGEVQGNVVVGDPVVAGEPYSS
jgi:hypothetical protein